MSKYYKYTLKKDYECFIEKLIGVNFSNEWLSIKNGVLVVRAGYSWDGCSPKFQFKVFGKKIVIGVPDGKNDKLKFPSLVHDVLCQFGRKILITKQTVNSIFYDMMKAVKWRFAKLYYFAVNVYLRENRFGGYYDKAN